jgi:type II secretion system protein N
MSDFTSSTYLAFRAHKGKVAFSILCFAFFIVALFPFDDLGDLVTEKIALNTNNQVFMQFDHLGVGFFPPSLAMKNVVVDTPFFTSIKASSMNLAPAIGRLLTFQPGVSIRAENLFKGNYSGSVGMVKKENRQLVEFNTSYREVDLLALSQFFESPWEVSGRANLFIDDGLIDPSMTEPPKLEIEMQGEKIGLPNTLPASIPLLGGTVIPTLKFSQVTIRGKLLNRELTIEEGILGSENDAFRGKIKGKMELDVRQNMNGQMAPVLGAYDLIVILDMDKAFEADLQKRLPILYDPISKFKTVTGKGSKFAIRIRAPNSMSVPEMSPGQAF